MEKKFSYFGEHIEFPRVTDNVRVSEEKIDFIYSAMIFPSNKIFKAIGEKELESLFKNIMLL